MKTLSVRINVYERPKRIEMCAFSNENVLVWGHSLKEDRQLNVVTNTPVFTQCSLPCNFTFLQNIVIKTYRH